jgi:hypothetical protein
MVRSRQHGLELPRTPDPESVTARTCAEFVDRMEAL